MTVLINID